ncbi:MAG: carboxymuconolactone decarboxylase family protein [Candidatus Omnitrophota bacterium]|jgi:AhpD family alkylhydroperoxidase
MAYLETIRYEEASPEVQGLLDEIKKKLRRVPNIYATVAHSPVALKAFLEYGARLKGGEFDAQETEAAALSIAQANHCHYCLAAHTASAKMSGLSEEDTWQLRRGTSGDVKLKAVAALAKDIVETQGHPSPEKLDAFFAAGYSKAALVELIALVSLNIFTNYFNHITDPTVDFPSYKEFPGEP